ncbi:MAG: caspase family protein [Chitinophagaceae bacterium]|nr:caspase family protein [Oligoflexus sp.]
MHIFLRCLVVIGLGFSTFGHLRADSARDAVLEGLRPKKFVLSIGMGKFQDPVWRELRFSRKDARDVYGFFRKDEKNFDGGELLSDIDHPLGPDDIRKAFARLEQDNRNEEDTVVVYVSTHGTVAYKDDGKVGRYIVTSKTDPKHMKDTALDYDQLVSSFQALKSRKKVLILAFCHSGVGKSVLTPEMKRALAQLKGPYFEEPIQERSEGSIILTASGWREPALEDERLQNDVYTHYLIEGFTQDRNGDGAVSITEAHAYAAQKTYDYTQGRQRPSAIMELLGSDPIIVSGSLKEKSKSSTASLFSLMDRFSKLVVSVDGKDYGSVEKGLTVPEGEVRLTIKDPENHKVLADRVVNFQSGREYSIANYLLPRLPHSLMLGVSVIQFLDQTTQKGYAPTVSQGFNLRYTYEEAFSLYDLVLEGSYFPEQKEKIEVDTQLSGRREFEQKRSMVGLMAGGSRRVPLDSLSRSDRSIHTDAHWLVGLKVLELKRTLSEPAFEQLDKSVATGGLTIGGGAEVTWAYHLVRAGFDIRADFLKNFTADSTRILTLPSASLYVGSFW